MFKKLTKLLLINQFKGFTFNYKYINNVERT